MRQGGHDPALHRGVTGLADVRVHPDQPMGEPAYAYYAEWEFPDRDAFKEAARSEEFMATGKDAMEMGGRFHVLFADVS